MGRPRVAVSTVALLIAAAAAGAQEPTCALSGMVGAIAGAPLSAAQVSSSRTSTTILTDSAGKFRLAGLPCGKHEIQVRKIGFTVRRDTIDLAPGQETTRTYGMIGVALLDTMRVRADEIQYQTPRLQDFEARRLKNVGGNFISEAKLRQLDQAGAHFTSILRNIPGLNVTFYGGGAYVRSRGSGGIRPDPSLDRTSGSPKGCWATVYLDGLMLFDGRMEGNIKPPDMNQFFTMNLSGVEYYASAGSTPLQYKSTVSNCGVLLLWTRGR